MCKCSRDWVGHKSGLVEKFKIIFVTNEFIPKEEVERVKAALDSILEMEPQNRKQPRISHQAYEVVECLVNHSVITEDDLGKSTVDKVAHEVPRINKEGLRRWRRRDGGNNNTPLLVG